MDTSGKCTFTFNERFQSPDLALNKKIREVYYVEVLCVKLRQARGCLGGKSVYSCMEA